MAELKLVGLGLRSYGNIIFNTDNAYDIGAAGATRPRDLHLGRNALIGGTLGVTGLITATGGISGGAASFTTGAFSGATLTFGGDAVAAPLLSINGNDGNAKYLEFKSAGVVKWDLYSVATTHAFEISSASVPALTITQAGAVNLPKDFSVGASAFVVTAATGHVGIGGASSASGLSMRSGKDIQLLNATNVNAAGISCTAVQGAAYAELNLFGGGGVGTGLVINNAGAVTSLGDLTVGASTFVVTAATGAVLSSGIASFANIIVTSTTAVASGGMNLDATTGLKIRGSAGATYCLELASDTGATIFTALKGATPSAAFYTGLAITGALTGVTTLAASGPATLGIGGTGATNADLDINGSSASGQGAQITFQRNSVTKGYIGHDSRINGGAGNDLVFYTPAGVGQKFYTNAALAMTIASGGAITLGAQPAFVAGSKYLVIDASGNVQVSALGPAS